MSAIISCKNFQLTDAIEDLVTSKVEKISQRARVHGSKANLEQVTPELFRVHLECSTDAFGSINATSKGEDLYVLIRECSDKLLRQIDNAKGKSEGKHSREVISEQAPVEDVNL